MKETIKGFGSIITGTILGGVSMGMTGSMGALKGAMDSTIGVGVLGNAIKNVKGMFK